MKQARVFPTVILLLLVAVTLFICMVVMITEVGAQGEYPLSDGVCGPVPTETVTTLRSFVARTAPQTQAPGSGGEIPRGTSFPVGTVVCDEGVTFISVQWDGQQRWLPSAWPTFGPVWRSVQPTPTFPVIIVPVPTAVATGACTPFLSPGLMVGGYGEVLTTSVNLRETPGGSRRGVLRNGDQFRVVEGPIPSEYLGICFFWWQVQTPQGDLGWVAEGSRWRLIGSSTAAG